jgi:CRP-like cAMP-binding protein
MIIQSEELKATLKQINLISHLMPEELDELVSSGKIREFYKGDSVYSEGEVINEFNVLLKGVIKISKEVSGREVLKSIQHSKTILDDLSISCDDPRTSNAIVLSPIALVFSVDCKVIRKIITSNSRLTQELIKYLSSKLKYAEDRLESFVLNDARERIVEFLKVSAEAFGQSVGYEMLLKHNFTQQDIANYTGTSRQTVTMVLNDLKKSNKIHFKRQSILIRDLKALA